MPAGFDPNFRIPALWTDTPDAMDRLRGLYATGAVTDAEAGDLAHFIDHGWLVWNKAIDEATIDALVADIRSLHQKPGFFLSTDFEHGRQKRLMGPKPDSINSIFDLYVNLQSAREVCLHARIARFLSLVFQARPLAFQQLLFQQSNGHGWHQDTAYVVVDTPMLLAATWIALEDIVEGTGELAFYDRSHRLPHWVFANGRKHHDGETSGDLYGEQLERACQERQLSYHRLLARKGDVFFWSADLVHRSHPRTPPMGRSRMACVTHYCPATSVPGFFSDADRRGIEPHRDLGGIASSYYKLPNLGEMVRPIPTWEYYD